MAGAISQPRQSCQFLFCLMKNPLLSRSAWPESSREASERFLMETRSAELRASGGTPCLIVVSGQKRWIFFPGVGNPGKASNNDIQVFSFATDRRKGSTLPQPCQNYMTLCVRIGKIDRLRPQLTC